eukprot:1138316-Pelagomonas_calceolata.AAC.2
MSKSVTGKIGQLTPSGKLQGILIQRCISKRFELDGKPVYDWVSFALAFRGVANQLRHMLLNLWDIWHVFCYYCLSASCTADRWYECPLDGVRVAAMKRWQPGLLLS